MNYVLIIFALNFGGVSVPGFTTPEACQQMGQAAVQQIAQVRKASEPHGKPVPAFFLCMPVATATPAQAKPDAPK